MVANSVASTILLEPSVYRTTAAEVHMAAGKEGIVVKVWGGWGKAGGGRLTIQRLSGGEWKGWMHAIHSAPVRCKSFAEFPAASLVKRSRIASAVTERFLVT